MNLLSVENMSYSVDIVPDDDETEFTFCVLDNSNPSDVDYYFNQLFFLESFSGPAVVLRVGEHKVQIPIDWHILIGDPEMGDLEALPITSINDRGFRAFVFNPISGFRPSFEPIEIDDVYQEVAWFSPRLKTGQYLCVPLTSGEKPPCAYFIRDVSRNNEVIDYQQAF